jgi:putative oxidoreductase
MRRMTPRRSNAIVRLMLGVPLIVFGLNGFLDFITPPAAPLPQSAARFLGALAETGYMMELIALTQLAVGILLVANRFVPFALVLLAPFLVQSIAFHTFLERSGLPMAIVLLALELYLAWTYRNAYRGMLEPRSSAA